MTKDEMHALLATAFPTATEVEVHLTTEEDWNEVEEFFGVKFPDKYKLMVECLCNFTQRGYIMEVGGQFGVVEVYRDLRTWYQPFWDEDHIPFADFGTGDRLIFFRSELPDSKICFKYFHFENLTLMAESFDEWFELFIKRLQADPDAGPSVYDGWPTKDKGFRMW